MPIRLKGSYDQDPTPFHQFIEERNRAELAPAPVQRMEPCKDCGHERAPGTRIQLEMSEMQAIFMQQEIDGGLCYTCAKERAQRRLERGARQLR